MAKNRKLGRNSSHRKAMLRNLVTSLLREGRIQTTHTRAKEVQKIADRMITLGKRGDLHARRQLFDEYAEKYADRNGGYTRVLKMGPRRGDGAEISIIELV